MIDGTEVDGIYTCRDHPEFRGDEVNAVLHLRTVHNPLWQALCQIQVVPITAPPSERPTRPPAPARPRTPKGSRRAGRHRK